MREENTHNNAPAQKKVGDSTPENTDMLRDSNKVSSLLPDSGNVAIRFVFDKAAIITVPKNDNVVIDISNNVFSATGPAADIKDYLAELEIEMQQQISGNFIMQVSEEGDEDINEYTLQYNAASGSLDDATGKAIHSGSSFLKSYSVIASRKFSGLDSKEFHKSSDGHIFNITLNYSPEGEDGSQANSNDLIVSSNKQLRTETQDQANEREDVVTPSAIEDVSKPTSTVNAVRVSEKSTSPSNITEPETPEQPEAEYTEEDVPAEEISNPWDHIITDNTLEGDDENNKLVGSEGNDIVIAGLGNDKIYVKQGEDVVLAGAGNDYIRIDDNTVGYVDGGEGRDVLDFNTNGDVIINLDGVNVEEVRTRNGNNSISNEGSDDAIVIKTRDGNDTLIGGNDNDNLQGGAGDDSIVGNAGNDKLYAGTGIDTVYGGEGNDYIRIDSNQYGVIDGGEGHDILDFNTNEGIFIYLSGLGIEEIRTRDGDDFILNQGNSEATVIKTGNGSDTVYGGNGNDNIQGGAGNDLIVGMDGNDKLYAGTGSDTVYGGNGNDYIRIDNANYADLNGGEGRDVLDFNTSEDVTFNVSTANFEEVRTRAGNDSISNEGSNEAITIKSSDGDDTLIGGNGNDNLQAGAGNDSVLGGEGNDKLYTHDGDDWVNGGLGNDYIKTGAGQDTIVIVDQSGTDNIADFTQGEDIIDISGALNASDEIYSFADILAATTTNTSKTIISLDGETIVLQKFTGTLTEDDFILAEAPSGEEIEESNGNDTVEGSEGNDTINSGNGQDTINANGGDDVITGGNGKDVLVGGAGADTLTGGKGKDTFRFDVLDEHEDHITDFTLNNELIEIAIDQLDNLGGSGDYNFNDVSFADNDGSAEIVVEGIALGIILDGITVNEASNSFNSDNIDFI